jgi:hypothetical protein
MSVTGATPVANLQHRYICPYDCPSYRTESEFQSHGRRDLIDPMADVDRLLLDEALARCLIGTGSRPRRRALAIAGLLATLMLILTVWLTMPM